MSKTTLWIGASLCLFSFAVYAGELLGHISEDTAQPMSDVKPSQSEDRRIIYRVICSPGDEQLPDCEHPVVDNETVVPPKTIESEANAPEIAENQEPESAPEPQQIVKAGKAKPRAKDKKTTAKTKAAKKSKTTKKAESKKTATKKPASKKKKH